MVNVESSEQFDLFNQQYKYKKNKNKKTKQTIDLRFTRRLRSIEKSLESK